jgi:subtilisin family serine protease
MTLLFNQHYILSVGSTEQHKELFSNQFSNYGHQSVDISAPREAIRLPIQIENTIHSEKFNGTSYAAPLVTGVASLLLAKNPQLSALELKMRLMATASYHEQWNDKTVSGFINAFQALSAEFDPFDGDPTAYFFNHYQKSWNTGLFQNP